MAWADPRVHPESNWFWLSLLVVGAGGGTLIDGATGAVLGIEVTLVLFAIWICYYLLETVFLLRYS